MEVKYLFHIDNFFYDKEKIYEISDPYDMYLSYNLNILCKI